MQTAGREPATGRDVLQYAAATHNIVDKCTVRGTRETNTNVSRGADKGVVIDLVAGVAGGEQPVVVGPVASVDECVVVDTHIVRVAAVCLYEDMSGHVLPDAPAELVVVDIYAGYCIGAVVVIAPDVDAVVMPYVAGSVPVGVVMDIVAEDIDVAQCIA